MNKLFCNHERKYVDGYSGTIYVNGHMHFFSCTQKHGTLQSTVKDFEHCARESRKMVIKPQIEKDWAEGREGSKSLIGYKLVWHF